LERLSNWLILMLGRMKQKSCQRRHQQQAGSRHDASRQRNRRQHAGAASAKRSLAQRVATKNRKITAPSPISMDAILTLASFVV
jgi:hypothetical protein